VLNELDQWIDGQWESNPVISKYGVQVNKNGSANKGNGYKAMRKTKLKEMHYAMRTTCESFALRKPKPTAQWKL